MGRLPVDHIEELHPLTDSRAPRIALVAGESSGDQLGAALMEQLRSRYPDARFSGIGGPRMKAAGLDTWWDASELSLFGLFEVLSHLPRLVRLRSELFRRLVELSPDGFIGIDAPDFNLRLEINLRRTGIRTVHYVSPTVWAWREKRVEKIARATDKVLCLFPFEPGFYAKHGVSASYVGHPMADQIDAVSDTAPAREQLGLAVDAPTVALLPGSRSSEVSRLAQPMLGAARSLAASRPNLQFVAAMANDNALRLFRLAMDRTGFSAVTLVEDAPRTVMAAADVVMCASGTATLETMLVNRPMVVAYRIAPATHFIAKNLGYVKQKLFALPNILAGEMLVPELIQHAASSERLAAETARWLDDAEARNGLRRKFDEIHEQLRCNAAARAAEAVAGLLES